MSLSTLTLLTQGTVWEGLRPRWFQVTFTEDDVIARVDFYSSEGIMDSLLNVESNTPYQVLLKENLVKIIFTPDAAETEHQLRITNIRWDMQYLLDYDPDRVTLYYEDGREAIPARTDHSITFVNGVGSGYSGLVVNAWVGYIVTYRGAILGQIISNTATTVTLDTNYSGGPFTTQFYPPFGSRLLAFASAPEWVHPPYAVEYFCCSDQYTAPPWPFESIVSATQRTSNVPVSEFTSIVINQCGLNFSV